ncbi:hypothetical protein FACS1894191_6820 [Clostridia bacterium]|nr:hypothetical protein FACS1894191_6820 [Clostridia bacterium]
MTYEIGEIFEGCFISELKNRFLCEVEINGAIAECYVPSSCHLSNFLELEGKPVLLRKNSTPKSRTQYALVAMPYKQSYLLLNSSLANRAVETCIQSRRFSFIGKRASIRKEHSVEGYKADLFVPEVKTIIEIKSIISLDRAAMFPTVYSERAITQLKQLRVLLQKGYKSCYLIISLNPYVKKIKLDRHSELFELFVECLHLGMRMKGFTCRLKDNQIGIDSEIPVDFASVQL